MSKHIVDEVDLANLQREAFEKGKAEGKKDHYQSAVVMDTQAEYFGLGRIQTRIELLTNLLMEFRDEEIYTVLQNQHGCLVELIGEEAIEVYREENTITNYMDEEPRD